MMQDDVMTALLGLLDKVSLHSDVFCRSCVVKDREVGLILSVWWLIARLGRSRARSWRYRDWRP
jgi:hypothetical protein